MHELQCRRGDSTGSDRAALDGLAGGWAAPAETSTAARSEQAIAGSGFPPLLTEHGRVVLSGFVIEPTGHEQVRVRWVGQPAIDSMPYRRTFLGVYASILSQAGLSVRYVADGPCGQDAHLSCCAP